MAKKNKTIGTSRKTPSNTRGTSEVDEMKKKKPGFRAAAELRRRAEKKAVAVKAKAKSSLSPEETRRTLHELHVHQIELELQNEELLRVQADLESARARYFDLYDLAPIGYFTVSEKGLIQEANLTAARLLGIGKQLLVKKPFTQFIHSDDQDVYYHHRKLLWQSLAPQVCEVRILNRNGDPFWARLESMVSREGMDGAPGPPGRQRGQVCRTVMSDISLLKQAEENSNKIRALLIETEKLGKIGGWSFDAEKAAETWTEETFRIFEIDLTQNDLKMRGGLDLIAPAFRPMAEQAIQKAITSGVPYDQEWEIVTARNNKRWVHAVAKTQMEKGRVKFVSGFFQDISELKQAEDKLKNSLAEKERLLKEIHDRIKSNLTTIIGLIKMQGTKAGDEMVGKLMQELEGRVLSVALTHESLLESKNPSRVDLQHYIETMMEHIHARFGAERDIHFRVQAAGVDINLDFAVPCGLILNELITNAYQHAFPGNPSGLGTGHCEIEVVARHQDGTLALTVADNGVGLTPGLDWEKSETLGLKLSRMLCGQLNGSLALDRSRGTAFHLHFPCPAGGG